ncbi:MAG: TRAP transporter large permease, partial [Syntrophomonadaceae bacterium]|nr:TRAP transporter large permease [Syntrophomonadaceae bacterium]
MLSLVAILLALGLFCGLSIYIALALPAFVAIIIQDIPLQVLGQQMFNALDKFSLMAIPFFILAANVMGKGGLAKRILDVANIIAGKYYGGTAIATVLACMFFGALCGSSPATVVAIGALVYPALLEAGYSKRFSMGLVVASSSIAIVIPPSITMIVYGSVTGASVGGLFMGGVGPGILMGLILMTYCYIHARKNNIRMVTNYTWQEKKKMLLESTWAMGVPVIIIGGIYGGVFTPTESATVSAVYAIIVGMWVYKAMNWKDLLQVSVDSAVTTAQIMMLVSGACVLSWVFTVGQLPAVLSGFMGSFQASIVTTLLLINVILIIAGMFMDSVPFILLLAPLFYPIAQQFGVSNVHLGVIMTMNGALGMFTPPFGLNLFVGMNVFKEKYLPVAKSALP